MNRKEEQALKETARRAKVLRETIDSADSMIRSWARHKKEAGTVSLYLTDRRHSSWRCSIDMPAEVIQADLVPVLKKIRQVAREELAALSLPEIKSP
jgi:hypothetical protein